jgi:hypothetical protein
MKNTKEQSCRLSFLQCNKNSEKPEPGLQNENKPSSPQKTTEQKESDQLWSVFKNVYWI